MSDTDQAYPWIPGDHLNAAALNAAIAAATTGALGPPGPDGLSFLSGAGPPTVDAPVGTTYLDVNNGDIWVFA
jgi:hypothetical protein